MSKVSKPLVIVGSAVLATALTTLVSAAEAKKHHGAPPPSPPHLHRPGLHRDLQGGAQAGGAGEDRRHQVCRRHRAACTTWRARYGTTARTTAGRASCLGPSRTAPGSTATSAGPRRTAPGAPMRRSAEVRRLRDRSGLRRQGRAHGRSSQRTEGVRRGAESGAQDRRAAGQGRGKGPRRGVGTAGPPGRRQCGQASECKKYFPSVGEMLPVPCTNDRSSL